jgi:hypothetical protein
MWIMGHHVSAMLHHRIEIPMYKTQEACTGKDGGPTSGFATSSGVGPACPRVPWLWLPAQGNSGATTCPVAPVPDS